MIARLTAAAALVSLLLSSPALAQTCSSDTDLPVLFVVQDKSTSMSEPPDPACSGCASKWALSRAAIGGLTSRFANRFHFGLEMFPSGSSATSCTVTSTTLPLGSDADAILAAYDASAPGGGSPTSASLIEARRYLTSLHLTVPAYVLLLTDGLPGCATNDGNDSNGKLAAASLRAAGIPVYVVALGASATDANSLSVLNAIASAGGTGSALPTSDEASLDAALSQVAAAATTCCRDACAAGTTECSLDREVRLCQADPAVGCTTWFTEACADRSSCVAGRCETCVDECALGAARCQGSLAQICLVSATGCTAWKDGAACGPGELCELGACRSCTDTCAAGESRCAGNAEERCALDPATGCTAWQQTACAPGSLCSDGTCQRCDQTCAPGESVCQLDVVATCAVDANGCTAFVADRQCNDFCSGGACGTCGTSCALGESRCNGSTSERCVAGQYGCSEWQPELTCGEGAFCAAGACLTCATSCVAGTHRCDGSDVERCGADADGCPAWVPVATCGAGKSCVQGACVADCEDECVVGAARCDGAARPQTCLRAASGCAAWTTSLEACSGSQRCVEGACRESCTGSDDTACPDGTVCTSLPEGAVCLPPTCLDQCTLGASRCGAHGGLELCLRDPSGCAAWQAEAPCGQDQRCAQDACRPSCGEGQQCQPGEACVDGVCMPRDCEDACGVGEARCDGSGRESCLIAASGCATWQDSPCDAAELCINGGCFAWCDPNSPECPEGTVCTEVPGGAVCQPVDPGDANPGGGLPGAGSGDDGAGGAGGEPGAGGPASGCGCNAGASGSVVPAALLVLGLALRRRRS